MKILFITPHYPLEESSVIGGVEGVCYYLAQALLKKGFVEVELLVPFARVKGTGTTIVDGIKVHIIPVNPKLPKYINIVWTLPRNIKRKANQLETDIIHVQNQASWSKNLQKPNVLTIHGINERDTLYRGNKYTRWLRYWINVFVNSRSRRKVNNIIAISPYVRQFLRSRTKQNIYDIENPVADSFFDIKRSPNSRSILFAGTVIERKNLLGLLEGFSKFLKDGGQGKLRIAGTGHNSQYGIRCINFVRHHDLDKHVTFLGSLSIEEMQKELSHAACLALCSFQETAPLVISEAMAAGVPVLASNVCGNPWMVMEGKTGRLVNPYDSADIARGMKLLLMQDNLAAMSREAKAQAEERFRASVVASKTLDVYKNILNKT